MPTRPSCDCTDSEIREIELSICFVCYRSDEQMASFAVCASGVAHLRIVTDYIVSKLAYPPLLTL